MHFYHYPYPYSRAFPHPGVFPPVNPDRFMTSARALRPVLSEAGILANRIATSRDFSRRIMDAAQQSKTETVKNLIVSAGIRKDVRVTYNPDVIIIDLIEQDCCKITLSLKWR
ncbi:hypothetical protein [Bacillus sp. B-jedd]|uniref:hypothetical protein n=1 Tax=Bacillus sp. B-jedd TaxID=1476857 RepID=UPI0005157298|nr:hypothetical protein [Bacillus sp. B-jedd]CEG28405.1 spore coat protein YuzC [Bacillus sp. B-jedd]